MTRVDLLGDSHSTSNRLENHFCQVLNVHRVHDVRQTEIHTVKPLVPDCSAFEANMAIEKLKIYQLPGIHTWVHSEMHKHIIFGIRKNCLNLHLMGWEFKFYGLLYVKCKYYLNRKM